jgi:hypothetical protein
MVPRIAAPGTSFSPLPCKARHGYKVTNAHRVEVEVGADGPASSPPSGVAAAAPYRRLGHTDQGQSPNGQHPGVLHTSTSAARTAPPTLL